MTTDKKFACAINCMDGRVQNAVEKYMKKIYGVDYVDMVTEPGPNKILAECSYEAIVENIEKRLEISVNHHGSKVCAIVGHFGCAGNPVAKEQQIKHLQKAKKTVEGFGLPVKVVLLWVDSDWKTAELVK